MDREQELILVRLAQRQRDQIRRQKENAAKAKERKEARRHTFPLVRVIHPVFGTLELRAESKCDAVSAAARLWGVPFISISRETEVWAWEGGERDLNALLTAGASPRPTIIAAGASPTLPFPERGCERRAKHGTVESE